MILARNYVGFIVIRDFVGFKDAYGLFEVSLRSQHLFSEISELFS